MRSRIIDFPDLGCVIREHVTIHQAARPGSETVVPVEAGDGMSVAGQ
jgi:hypothetical protein